MAEVTTDALRTLRAELAELRSDLYRAMLIQAGCIVGAIAGITGLVIAALRFTG